MGKIKLSQLEALVRAVDAGSISGASVELGCTQSRISHAVGQLEAAVGTRLLRRSRTGCTTTEAGSEVLRGARTILELVESIAKDAGQQPRLCGSVRLACIRSVGSHLVPHSIEAMLRDHPDIRVEINDGCHDYADVTALLRQGLADIGITRSGADPSLSAHDYVLDDYVAVVPNEAPLALPLRWEQLEGIPFIHVRQRGAMWIVEQCRRAGFQQRPDHLVASEGVALAMVGCGLGYALLPRLAAFPDLQGTKVLELPVPVARHLAVFASPAAAERPLVNTLLRYLLDKRWLTRSDAWRAGVVRFAGSAMNSPMT